MFTFKKTFAMDFLDNTEDYIQSPYWKLILIGLIDAAIVLFGPLALGAYEGAFAYVLLLSPLVLFAIYRFVSLLLFNRTIGMAICKSQLLNGELEPLKIEEKFLAGIFILYKGTEYYEINKG